MKWNSMLLTKMSTVNHNNLKYAPLIETPRQQRHIKLTYYTNEWTQITGLHPKKMHKNDNGKWMDNKFKKREQQPRQKCRTYSQRMKSFIKINTFNFILKQKGEKGGYRKLKLEHG